MNQISHINDYTVFAGTFSQVYVNASLLSFFKINVLIIRESISLRSYFEGQSDVVVNNIVKMDAKHNFTVLEDPENVFSCQAVDAIATTGEMLFILCSAQNSLYSWDPMNFFQFVYAAQNVTPSTMAVDAHGNLFALSIPSFKSTDLIFFNASDSYSGWYHIHKQSHSFLKID